MSWTRRRVSLVAVRLEDRRQLQVGAQLRQAPVEATQLLSLAARRHGVSDDRDLIDPGNESSEQLARLRTDAEGVDRDREETTLGSVIADIRGGNTAFAIVIIAATRGDSCVGGSSIARRTELQAEARRERCCGFAQAVAHGPPERGGSLRQLNGHPKLATDSHESCGDVGSVAEHRRRCQHTRASVGIDPLLVVQRSIDGADRHAGQPSDVAHASDGP